MAKPFFLSALDAAKNARKAFDEKRLQFQQTNLENGECRYRPLPTREDIGCAIGVSLPHQLALDFDNLEISSIGWILKAQLIETDDSAFLTDLQIQHDQLVGRINKSEYQARFLKLIDERIAAHG